MAKSRGGSYAGDAQNVVIPQSSATPTIPVDFLYNADDNQLECDRDSGDNMSSGTFHFEYWADDGATNPINVADGDWTALTAVANPASGSVIRSLSDQVSGRWYRAWKVASGNYVGPKTLPIQNQHPARLCLVKGKVGDVLDISLSPARVYVQPVVTDDVIAMNGGKQVWTNRRVVYPDTEGAWSVELYRTVQIGYNYKFWFVTRYGRVGPFTKIVPNQTEVEYVNLVTAS